MEKLKREWAKYARDLEIIKFYAMAKQYGFLDPSCRLGYCGTGRKYGVTDNAIRKWIKKEG